MSQNIMTASNQWANRPADERYWTLNDMAMATASYKNAATETSPIQFNSLRVAPPQPGGPQEPVLIGPNGGGATFTHSGFSQICQMAGAPASYLRTLPPALVSSNLGHSIRNSEDKREVVLLMHVNGGRSVRAATSERYTRVWNADIVRWMAGNLPVGWVVPPARPSGVENEQTRIATEADVLPGRKFGLSIKVGDVIAPAGLYASDHDMFMFMVDQTRAIEVPGAKAPLYRGFFVRNNEIGTGSLVITTFLYDAVCGNHIVWGATNVQEHRFRHLGSAINRKFANARNTLIADVRDRSVNAEILKIMTLRAFRLGASKTETVEVLDKASIASRRTLEAAYTVAEQHVDEHGDPNTAWGMMSGMTRLSQQSGYSDKRDEMDRAGAKILEMAF